MKIENESINKSKLLTVKLIKSKIYKKKHYLQNIRLEDIEYRLKKALYIIYSYHIHNKQIMFVGNPLQINKEIKEILQHSKHIFIPKDEWISGVITNQHKSFKFLLKKQKNNSIHISKRLLELKKKSDLIVIIDEEINIKALTESYIAKVPVISLNSVLNTFNKKSTYKIPGNFIISKNTITKNVFYSILLATLSRSNQIKKKFPTISHKLSTTRILKKRFKRKNIRHRYK
jgi:ribosomal protein S2